MRGIVRKLDEILGDISDLESKMFVFQLEEFEETQNFELNAELCGISKRILTAQKELTKAMEDIRIYAQQTRDE